MYLADVDAGLYCCEEGTGIILRRKRQRQRQRETWHTLMFVSHYNLWDVM